MIIIVGILILIFILYILYEYTINILSLRGLWISSTECAKDMNVDNILLMIGTPIQKMPLCVYFNCLLFVKKDNKMIIGEKTEVCISYIGNRSEEHTSEL